MTYFKRFESVRWIKIPTTNSKEEYDLKCPEHVWNVLWSQSSLFLLFVLFVWYCAGSQQGSILYPSVRAYDSICHTVTWLHKQLLGSSLWMCIYVCVLSETVCWTSRSWPLWGPRHLVHCHFLLTQMRSWGDSAVGAKQPPSGVCLPTKPSATVGRSDI